MASKRDERLKYIAVYFFTWLSGLIAIILAKKDGKLKYHGKQAFVLGVVIVAAEFLIPVIGSLIALLLWLLGIYVGYEAGAGKDIKLPLIRDLLGSR